MLSDRIVIRITSNPGETFIDRMIALVEGLSGRRRPTRSRSRILLAGMTIIFLLAVVTLVPFAAVRVRAVGRRVAADHSVLAALLVCLIPTTIGGLLSAIGIAGMDRVMQDNVLAMSGKAVEAAGDVNTLLLDKTGTITLGNRQAVEFIPLPGVDVDELADAAQLSSLADETPEGRSIVVLAKEKYGLRGRELHDREAEFIPFTAQTRMSGVNLNGNADPQGRRRRRQALGAGTGRQSLPPSWTRSSTRIANSGGTPLVVARDDKALWASSISRTSSRAACGTASTSFARWASGPS